MSHLAGLRFAVGGGGARRALLAALVLLLAAAAPPVARAQSGTTRDTAAEAQRLESECARLRATLDRAQAEIAALKRDRGIRSDYRLRDRMAEAESIARRLTEAEARLRTLRGTPPASPSAERLLAEPRSTPHDGPVELEAKADLLADQARRLGDQADAMARAATQIRSRQTLRRRAGALERDPFLGIESSKRTVIGAAPRKPMTDQATTGGSGMGDFSAPTTTGGAPAPMGDAVATRGEAAGAPPPAGPTPTAAPSAPGGAAVAPASASGPASRVGAASGPSPTAPQAPAAVTGEAQLRTWLDPATLAQIQRLLASGRTPADADALEQASRLLRDRARALDTQAKALRDRAGPAAR